MGPNFDLASRLEIESESPLSACVLRPRLALSRETPQSGFVFGSAFRCALCG